PDPPGSPRRPGRDTPWRRTCAAIARATPLHCRARQSPLCRTSGNDLEQALYLALVDRTRIFAVVELAGARCFLPGRVAVIERIQQALAQRFRRRIHEETDFILQHLRMRPDARGHQRLAAGPLLVALQRPIRALP